MHVHQHISKLFSHQSVTLQGKWRMLYWCCCSRKHFFMPRYSTSAGRSAGTQGGREVDATRITPPIPTPPRQLHRLNPPISSLFFGQPNFQCPPRVVFYHSMDHIRAGGGRGMGGWFVELRGEKRLRGLERMGDGYKPLSWRAAEWGRGLESESVFKIFTSQTRNQGEEVYEVGRD